MSIGLEEFLKVATPEQGQILFHLRDLALKENELAEKINRIYSTANNWPGIYSNGEGITLCEDEDDAGVISIGPKQELLRIRTQMAELLKKAVVELKMGDVGIIQRQYKNYVNK